MQTTPTAPETGDLRELWSSTARRATDVQLVVCVALGFAAAIGFSIGALLDLRRALRWWPLVTPLLLAGAFGVWGIADRELAERNTPRVSQRLLVLLRWSASVGAGFVAALAAMGILRLTIGTWIS